ncbi:nck-associated protein 5-like [Corythoichthys intestinalis]|uniref:nck-associated protein 5-like n=1 Tax=Corythoichthys intestinalis TaxID=161448 RepID=UPI0025A4FFCB|nr:nck-associated protein 5-like [Corythoichthys intestinalis]XP_057713723.1 nck-associated protein 5-like [Corythoichthys intestinalis]XP_057713731.1 nck-associated protein 5-like [Corythoichthys intestinalis]
MRTMSGEAEQRTCDEDFCSDEEADVESYLEDNSSELMDRLKELEAENSALILANESQREAYERCLDEVANHVVQALLNQKDLREECIKLKMLVFDLEKQNRALCELFQQKLPHHPTAHYQVQAGPLLDYNAALHNDSAKHLEAAQSEAQAKGNGYRTQHSSPGPRGPVASMEALSPFFKKKAHILEVLRKMEETDPLKFHPATSSLSFCDYSQVLVSTEAVLASADPLQCKSQQTHRHCSRSDTDALRHVNGDGAAMCEGGNACCLHCKRSPDAAPQARAAQSGGTPASSSDECHAKSQTAECVPPPKQRGKNDSHSKAANGAEAANQSQEGAQQEQETEELTGFSPVPQVPASEGEAGDAAPHHSDESSLEPETVRADASVSPSPSCLSDVKAAAINSPSKLLKFLKIPSIGDKCQASNPVVRLSPQLTRSSRIPCRTNTYEVYHSPVPTRRATTTERCRQPPPPPTRSESYPATHTSPQQPEDACPPPAKGSFSASKTKTVAPSSSPKVADSVPLYENICDLSTKPRAEEPIHALEKRTTLPAPTKNNVGERKLVKSLPESVLAATAQQKVSSSSASESSSEDEEDSYSSVWVNHQGPPDSTTQCGSEYSQNREEAGTQNCEATRPPPPARRTDSSSIPKRPAAVSKSQADSSHHAFKDRLAALGKLRSSEDLQAGSRPVDVANETAEDRSKTAERHVELYKEEQRLSKYTDSLDGKPRGSGGGLKYQGVSQLYEQGGKSPVSSGLVKQELCVSSKTKIGLPSPNADAPQVLRNNIKCPGSLYLPYNVKPGTQSSISPNKIPPKSPSKPCQGPSVHRPSKPADAPRYSSKSAERSKIVCKGKKNPVYGDSLPPPPPRPPTSEGEKAAAAPGPSPQSAIEQKVMKGIEENMLKLQEQDRGAQPSEAKQKASNGIASWFGRKKSKLPALSRKTDAAKAKDEKREWKINIPSVGKESVKMAGRCQEGVEGLNISTLMEKAEGLRRALEEERAYVERSGRGHSCEVVMDQAQGQLAVMYRGGRSDNFMQQLLNRVDGKEVVSAPQRRLSFDCKTSRPLFAQQSDVVVGHVGSGDDVEKASRRLGKITSDENLSDSVHSTHFADSGASTYTLDSGIGTFPLPDGGGAATGRGLSKGKAEPRPFASPGRSGRRARTLDRDPASQEEFYSAHKQSAANANLTSKMEGRSSAGDIREDNEAHRAHVFSTHSKTWTFPNLKTPAGQAEVYLAVEEEGEEVVSFAAPFRASLKAGGASPSRVAEPGGAPAPTQSGASRRTKGPRAPGGVTEVGRDAGLELLRERPEEALSPGRPQVLETPESLSDSLYDSLSSCGSQG